MKRSIIFPITVLALLMFFAGTTFAQENPAHLGVPLTELAEGPSGLSLDLDEDFWNLEAFPAPQGAPAGERQGRTRGSRSFRARNFRGGFGRGGGRGWYGSPRLHEELELTDEQTEKLRQMRVEARKAAVRNRADLQVQRIELGELLRADSPSKAQVDRKVQQITKLQGAAFAARINTMLSAKAVLTPEQRAKARELRKNRGRRFRGRRGGGSRGGPHGGDGFRRRFNRPAPPPPITPLAAPSE